jgi:hypothetical protein
MASTSKNSTPKPGDAAMTIPPSLRPFGSPKIKHMKLLELILITCLVPLSSVHSEPASAPGASRDPTGTWAWSTKSPTGEIPTTLKLELKKGKIAGVYSNQFGNTAISNASLQDDVIRFDVERDLGGNKYVVKYQGKVEGDTIKGIIEAPGHDGGEPLKLDWNAKRTTEEKAADTKPKG